MIADHLLLKHRDGTVRNSDLCNDSGARNGVFKGIMMLEGKPKQYFEAWQDSEKV
ncbi:MAG: hypothetical protein WCJ02_11850 [bacterium]